MADTPTFRLRVEGTASQRRFWSDTQPGEVAHIGPLGCGKTYALGIKALILQRANAGTNSILMVPTPAVASRVHVCEWPELWAAHDHRVKVKGGDDPCFIWPWGDRTWIVSAEAPDRMKSINAGHALIDEPGQIDRTAFDVCISRVRHPRATIRQTAMCGTPEGINWFADEFGAPTSQQRRTIWASGWHRSQAHYPEQLKRIYGYDTALLATYGRGEFTSLLGGGAYRQFRASEHVSDSAVYDRCRDLILSCDFNIDAMRWLVIQTMFDELTVIDEIALGNSGTTEQAAREFVDRYADKRHRCAVIITGDASGKARKTSASKVDYQVIEETLAPHFHDVRREVSEANPRVRDRVEGVNYHLSGRGRCVRIHPRCVELIADLQRVRWRDGQADLDKSDQQRTHASDALGYAVWNLARPILSVGRTSVGVASEGAHVDDVASAVY